MRSALIALLAGAVLTGCGLTGHGSPPEGAPMPPAGTSPSPVEATVASPGPATDPVVARGSGQRALSRQALERALLVEGDLPARDLHQDPSFAEDTGAPPVTRGPAACTLVSEALSTSYQRGASAIRLRGFTVGNMGPAVIEGIAALPGGAGSALASLRAGFARCRGYRVGAGKLSTTYVVKPYRMPAIGDGRAGVALTGSFPDTPDYIQIRVAVVGVGHDLVMVCTFGILGNGISDTDFVRIVRTAARRVAEAH